MSNHDLTLVCTDGNQWLISKPENQTWLETEKPLRKHWTARVKISPTMRQNHPGDCRRVAQVRAGAGGWRCMFSGIEFDCMGERIVAALCLLMDAISTVCEEVREESRMCGGTEVVSVCCHQDDSCMMTDCGLKVKVQLQITNPHIITTKWLNSVGGLGFGAGPVLLVLCEGMVSVRVCVPVHMQVHWSGGGRPDKWVFTCLGERGPAC